MARPRSQVYKVTRRTIAAAEESDVEDFGPEEFVCELQTCRTPFWESCSSCRLSLCRDHLQNHPCDIAPNTAVASSSTGVPRNTSDSRQRGKYSLVQKEIAAYLSSHMGAPQAASFLGVHRSMINRWAESIQYRPAATCPPPPDTLRQLDDIVRLRPEERTDAENKKVFEFHACRDVDEFLTGEQFAVTRIEESNDQDDEPAQEAQANDRDEHLEAILDEHLQMAATNDVEVNFAIPFSFSVCRAIKKKKEARCYNCKLQFFNNYFSMSIKQFTRTLPPIWSLCPEIFNWMRTYLKVSAR